MPSWCAACLRPRSAATADPDGADVDGLAPWVGKLTDNVHPRLITGFGFGRDHLAGLAGGRDDARLGDLAAPAPGLRIRVLTGKVLHHLSNREANAEALQMLNRAIALDPNYAHAHAWESLRHRPSLGVRLGGRQRRRPSRDHR